MSIDFGTRNGRAAETKIRWTDADGNMKSAVTTIASILLVGLGMFFVQWDLLRDHSYQAYLRANVLYFEAPDFGFARDPLFWAVLVASTFVTFGIASFIGAAVGGNTRGVLFGVVTALFVHLLLRYIPRIGQLTWEYHVAFIAETTLALGAAMLGAQLGMLLRQQFARARREAAPSNSV